MVEETQLAIPSHAVNMSHRVRLSKRAQLDIDSGHQYRLQFSEVEADRWRDWLLDQLEQLRNNPSAYQLADEAEEGDIELHQFVIGKRKNKYRVLFEIRDDEVRVLYIHHSSRGPIE